MIRRAFRRSCMRECGQCEGCSWLGGPLSNPSTVGAQRVPPGRDIPVQGLPRGVRCNAPLRISLLSLLIQSAPSTECLFYATITLRFGTVRLRATVEYAYSAASPRTSLGSSRNPAGPARPPLHTPGRAHWGSPALALAPRSSSRTGSLGHFLDPRSRKIQRVGEPQAHQRVQVLG